MNYTDRDYFDMDCCYDPPKKPEPPKPLNVDEFSMFQLVSALDRKLCKIVEGSDRYLLVVLAARRALKELKKFC